MLIEAGVVTAVGPRLPAPPGAEVVDASGLLVLPGAIDAHVHGRDPGFPEKEDFGTLTAAAAAGGVTTVVDMPNSVPAVDDGSILAAKAALVGPKAWVDFAFWGLLRGGSTPEQLKSLATAGAVGFKAYLGYAWHRGRRQVLYTADLDDAGLEAPPDYGTLARLAPVGLALGMPVAVHCEDAGVLRAFRRRLESYADLLAARPAEAEAVAVAAVGEVARSSGARFHVPHLSSAAGLGAALRARAGGADLSLETCPQYLWLSAEDHDRLGGVLRMNPPVRTQRDRDALLEAAFGGQIDVVATDHAPHADSEKLGVPLEAAHPGSPGVQTLLLSCLELGRRQGDFAAALHWVTEGPARLLGLHPRKGSLLPGSDGDLVLVDPGAETVVAAAQMRSRQRHGPLEGQHFGFAVRGVYVRGRAPGTGVGRLLRPL